MASLSEDFAYLAGLLDGEGCVTYKKYWDRKRKDRPRKYFCWRIQMEIVMTHKPTIQWCADTFGGKVYLKPRKTHKMQYRWRRGFREASILMKHKKIKLGVDNVVKIKKKGPVPGTSKPYVKKDYSYLPKYSHEYVER